MRLTQQVVGKILDGFAWREMVGHRLVGAMIQPHHVNGAAGLFGRLIADGGGDILDLTTIAIPIEGDGNARYARSSDDGAQVGTTYGWGKRESVLGDREGRRIINKNNCN